MEVGLNWCLPRSRLMKITSYVTSFWPIIGILCCTKIQDVYYQDLDMLFLGILVQAVHRLLHLWFQGLMSTHIRRLSLGLPLPRGTGCSFQQLEVPSPIIRVCFVNLGCLYLLVLQRGVEKNPAGSRGLHRGGNLPFEVEEKTPGCTKESSSGKPRTGSPLLR